MTAPSTGAVYDRGYRTYDGVRGGRRAATLALYRASLRRAIGLRRPWRQKLMPAVLLGVVSVPAVVNVGVAYLLRNTPGEKIEFITYREYVGVSSALLLFVAIVAPDVVCPDRRQRVLSLIFARQITGRDYTIAKLGAIFTCVFLFGFLPQVVLFVGQLLVAKNSLDYFRDNAEVLWQVPVAVAALALFYASLSVAAASLTGRRIVAAATVLGITLVTSTVSGILVAAGRAGELGSPGQPAALVNVLALPLYVRDLVFLGRIGERSALADVDHGGPMALALYAVIVVGCITLILRRYRSDDR